MDEDLHFSDLIGQIDCNFFDEFPEVEFPVVQDSASPDSISSWINHIENALLNDDEDNAPSLPTPSHDFCDSFLADLLVDSHEQPSVIDFDSNASDCGNDLTNSQKEDVHKVSPAAPTDDCCGSFVADVLADAHGRSSGVDAVVDVLSNASNCGDDSNNSQKEKVDAASIDESVGEDDDAVSKKRRRYCYWIFYEMAFYYL